MWSNDVVLLTGRCLKGAYSLVHLVTILFSGSFFSFLMDSLKCVVYTDQRCSRVSYRVWLLQRCMSVGAAASELCHLNFCSKYCKEHQVSNISTEVF